MTKISQEDCSIRSFKRIINRCGIFFLFLFFFLLLFFHFIQEWNGPSFGQLEILPIEKEIYVIIIRWKPPVVKLQSKFSC